jgi:hypothetical protein
VLNTVRVLVVGLAIVLLSAACSSDGSTSVENTPTLTDPVAGTAPGTTEVSGSSQQDGVPQGMVTFYAVPGGKNLQCPVGWQEAQYATGRLILATTDPAQTTRWHGPG